MKKNILILLSCILCFCLCFATAPAFAAEVSNGIEVTSADILRGARSNVNRDLMAVNIEQDGVILRGVFETNKTLAKAAIKKGVAFSENFSIQTEILSADPSTTVDIGFIYGDVDEAWLDPWDFWGIDMNDPGSLGKFKNIGGFTVRFSMTGNSISTLMMKGVGEDQSNAAFAVAGVTQQLPFVGNRDVTFTKTGDNWSVLSANSALPFEENATKLNPSGSENAQTFINTTLNSALGKDVYVFISMAGEINGSDAAIKIRSAGGKNFTAPRADDALLGDVSYNKNPAEKIEFSLAENYYLGLPEYAGRNFTYLSQPYMNPSYTLTEKGLYLSGRDKQYGVNADLTYLTPYEKFNGFSAVLSVGEMPKTVSALNSSISLTLNGQKFASYYAWNSVYIKITFPYDDNAQGLYASILLWGEPAYPNGVYTNTLVAEMPASYIPATDDGDVVIKVAKTGDNYYIYINGVRFGDGFETALNSTIEKIETGYTDAEGEHRGFYVSTLNATSYVATGLGIEDNALNGITPGHYIKQIGGAKIVNEIPTLKTAQAPYAPSKGDVTANSITLSFSSEMPDRTDGNFTVDGYLVERYINEKLDKTFIVEGAANRTFTDTQLAANTRYIYRVYAVQGAKSDIPVKLVAYQPIVVKTLTSQAQSAVGGTLITIFGIGGALISLVALSCLFAVALPKKRAVCKEKGKSFVCAGRARRIKPLVIVLSICLMLGMLSGCGGGPDEPGEKFPEEEGGIEVETMLDTFENITTPGWKSDIMYNETVLMLKGNDGVISGKLAFQPKKVLSVRNYSLDTTYQAGKDYNIDEDGVITLTENTACPYLLEENLLYATRPQGVDGLNEFPSSSASKPNLMYTETAYLVQKQLCITYEYEKSDFDLSKVSTANEEKLPAFRAKISSKSQIRMAVLGDSISEGANSSGKLNIAPYQPTYSSLFRQYVEKTFGADIVFENYSMGGMASAWGASRAYAVGQFMPDIVILSFGANDGGTGIDNSVTPVSVEAFTRNMQAAMDNIRKYNPDCEFIIVSSLMPNPAGAVFGIQGQYAEAMDELVADDNRAVSVDMYHLHEYFIQECGKHYADMSSNYINHPNDFLIRLYTMNIISSLWK